MRLGRIKWTCIVAALLGCAGGCNILGPGLYMLNADRTRKVPAEYGQLKDKRVCIWVWADDAITFEYPVVRTSVANHARFYINQHVRCKFVDPVAVDKFRKSNYESDRLSVVEIGKHFDADVVLFIQVHEFRTCPRESPSLLQGYIGTQCALYDCRGELPVESPRRRLWSGPVEATYPEKRPQTVAETNVQAIRSTTLKVFGQTLAYKFYAHYEPLGD